MSTNDSDETMAHVATNASDETMGHVTTNASDETMGHVATNASDETMGHVATNASDETMYHVAHLKEHFLDCPICMEEFDDGDRKPRLLPCLHTFCNVCLEKLRTNEDLKCSICQQIYPIEDDYANIPMDRTRRDLLDYVRANTNPSAITCENCRKDKTASHRCEDCSFFLCKECFDAHEMMKLIVGEHKIFSLEDEISGQDFIPRFSHHQTCMVQDHKGEKLTYYCSGEECNSPICMKCYVFYHSDKEKHSVKEIAEVFETENSKLKELSQAINDKAEKTRSAVQDVKDTSQAVGEYTSKAIQEIDAAFDVCRALLEMRREELKMAANDISEQKQEVLDQQADSLSYHVDCMVTECDFLEQSVSSANKAAFLTISPSIDRKFKITLEEELENLPFQTAYLNFVKQNMASEFSDCVKQLGCLLSSSLFASNTKMDVPESPIVNREYALDVQLYDNESNPLADDIVDVQVLVTAPDEGVADLPCVKTEEGSYRATWIPATEGKYLLETFAFNGEVELYKTDVHVANVPVHKTGVSPDVSTEELLKESVPCPSRGAEATKVAYLSMHMDESTLYKDRYMSEDRMTLLISRNPPPQKGRTDGQHYSYDWPVGGHALQKYQGVRGSNSISGPDNVYFEVEVDYKVSKDLTRSYLVFEVGLVWGNEVDEHSFVAYEKHGWAINLHESGKNKHVIRCDYCNNSKSVTGHTISSSKSGTTHILTLGVNVDTPNQTITFVDPVSHKRLHRFEGVDTAQPLWPVFGVYNPHQMDVRLTMRPAEGVHIPVDLLQ